MQTLATVTYLLFMVYLANFLMLSAVAAKEANRPVWLLGRSERGQRLTGWLFRLAFFAAVVWPPLRMWTGGLPSDTIAEAVQGTATSLIGHLLVAVGAAVALVSQYHMGSAWRIGVAKGQHGDLVVSGPFSLSRNPVFLGQGILFAGMFLAFPDVVQLLISATVILAALRQVQIEETFLRTTFGKDYEDYAARVPRWIGRITPARKRPNSPAPEPN